MDSASASNHAEQYDSFSRRDKKLRVGRKTISVGRLASDRSSVRDAPNRAILDNHNLNLIRLSNLHWDFNVPDLRNMFGKFGKVELAEVEFDRSGRSTGQGYVGYKDIANAREAYKEMHGSIQKGLLLHLEITNEVSAHRRRDPSRNVDVNISTIVTAEPGEVVVVVDRAVQVKKPAPRFHVVL